MRFVGCALAWRPGEAREKESCLVVMDERGSIIANSFAGTPEELRGAIEAYGEERRGIIVGVDAPLSIPNERGTRRIERILSKLALPAYSASRKMFGNAPLAEDLLAELEGIGVEYTDYPFPRERGQKVVVEVDSAAALRSSPWSAPGATATWRRRCGACRTPSSARATRRAGPAAIRGAIEVLWDTPGLRLRTGNLSADLTAEENIDVSKLEVAASMSHAELDRVLALVEGTLAAYTVHRHWRGRDGSMVVGSGTEGSVLLPAKDALRDRIAEEARAAGVPYV